MGYEREATTTGCGVHLVFAFLSPKVVGRFRKAFADSSLATISEDKLSQKIACLGTQGIVLSFQGSFSSAEAVRK